MTKRLQAKYKIDRRLGVNLWGRPKSPFNVRPHRPGEQGQRRRKVTDYGTQLAAKQKLKGFYGNLNERQFRNVFREAARLRGDTGENLVQLLESRLDAVVYHMKFAPTVFCSRQLINHGHIKVNGKRVNIPSYRVREGDLIEVKDSSKNMDVILGASQSSERDIPEYLDVSADKLLGKFLRSPTLSDVPYPVQMEPHLVIEYYSR